MRYFLEERYVSAEGCECGYGETILDLNGCECRKYVNQIYRQFSVHPENTSTKEDILQEIALRAAELGRDAEVVYDPYRDIEEALEILKSFSEGEEGRKKYPVRIDIPDNLLNNLLSIISPELPKSEEERREEEELKDAEEKNVIMFKITLDKSKRRILGTTFGKQRKIMNTYLTLRIAEPERKITYAQIKRFCRRKYRFAPHKSQIAMAMERTAERLDRDPAMPLVV